MKMKFTLQLIFILCLVGCSSNKKEVVAHDEPLPPKLEEYFIRYCGYVSPGTGIVGWETFDYRFRQQLTETEDPELIRLYVIYEMFIEFGHEVRLLEEGNKRVGKVEYMPLSWEEKQKVRSQLLEQITDLKRFISFTDYATPLDGLYDYRMILEETPPGWSEADELERRVKNTL
jgi:hypothetical protein